MEIGNADFEKIEMRIGRIIDAEPFPEAKKPAYKLKIDFGEFGIRNSSAQITALYRKEDLIRRQVVCVTNFPPKNVAGFRSEVLALGVANSESGIILLSTEREAPLGARVF